MSGIVMSGNTKKKITAAVVAAVGVLYFPYVLKLEDTMAVSNSIICIPLLIGYYLSVKWLLDQEDKRLYCYTGVLGCVFAFFLSAGRQLGLYRCVDYTSHTTWVTIAVYAIIIASLLAWIFKNVFEGSWFKQWNNVKWIKRWDDLRHAFLFNVVALFVCWVPYWLACWPGNWVYDLTAVWRQYESGALSAWQPPLHTVFMCSIIDIPYRLTGDFNQGIALYTFVQMVLIAMVFSYTLQCMRKWSVSRGVRFISFVWLAIFPLIPMAVVTGAKDIIFAASMLWFVDELIMLWYVDRIKTAHVVRIVVTSFVAMAYRNNAVYAIIVFLLFVMVWKGLRQKKKLIGSIVIGVACYFVWTGPIFDAMNIHREDSREMLSVPIQQIGRVYMEVGPIAFSEEDRKLVWEVGEPEVWFKYAAKCSDPIKELVNVNVIEERTKDCLKVWIKTGLKYPNIYIDSFLENTMDSWYPDTVVDGYKEKHGKLAAESSYFVVGIMAPGSRQESKIPFLRTFMLNIAQKISYHKISGVSMLFSIGAAVWFMFVSFTYLWYRGDWRGVILLVPILYSLTVWLGPMVLLRYYLHVFFLMPVMLGLIICPKVACVETN